MKKFDTLESPACPLKMPNIDTDQIIPKQFLKRIERTGFGQFLFYDWRYLDNGKENPEFVLNSKKYQGAKILLALDNFGCGSSREHAPWALLDYGFECIIAPSFADIFYNNCFQNGILPVILKPQEVDTLFDLIESNPETVLKIDLSLQEITFREKDSPKSISFDIDSSKKQKLLEGLDDISMVLKHEKKIESYERKAKII